MSQREQIKNLSRLASETRHTAFAQDAILIGTNAKEPLNKKITVNISNIDEDRGNNEAIPFAPTHQATARILKSKLPQKPKVGWVLKILENNITLRIKEVSQNTNDHEWRVFLGHD